MFFPESLSLVQSITAIASNKDLPKDIRDQIAQAAAKWSAKILDKTLLTTTLKSAIDVYIKDLSNAAAQNVIIELSDNNLELFFASLVHLENQLDSKKLIKLLSILDPTKKHTSEYLKKMSLEVGFTRDLSIELLKSIPRELIISDIEWAKKIAALALDATYSQLMVDYDLFNIQETQDVFVGLLKGASTEDKDKIILLISKYKSHTQAAEEQLLKRTFMNDSVSNPTIRDALITSALKHSNDTVIRKKWVPYITSTFNYYFNSQEQIPLNVLDTFVRYYSDLAEVFKSKWPGKKNDNKKWLKLYLDWCQSVGTPNFTKASSTILSSFWKEPAPTWIEELFTSKFIDVVVSSDWQTNKQLVSPIRTLMLAKTSTAAQKRLGLKLLHIIDPKKLSKQESKELLSNPDCALVTAEDLFISSGLSTDEYFGIYLGCYQRGLVDRTKIIEFFLLSKLNIEARKKLFINSIDNLLYDRVFRASLLSVAGALSIGLDSQSKTIQELLKDSDPMVQTQTLDSLSRHNSAQIQPILPLMRGFIENTDNIHDNRAAALIIYLKNSVEEPNLLVELLQSLLSTQPVAKALINQYNEIPSHIYVQALSNKLPDLDPSVKITALGSLLLATDPVLLDGIPIELLSRLQDSKVEAVKELANICIILKSLLPNPELETLITSVLFTNSRWKLLDTKLRSRIPEAVISKLKLDLCPQSRTACLLLDSLIK